MNWSGQVEDHLDYNAYGVATESNPSVGSPIEYDGYQYEAATGLDYTQARWYNPSTGTWQTQDPAGFAAGQANLNQYVGNDPTNETDPTGLGAGNGWSADSGSNGNGGGIPDGVRHVYKTLTPEFDENGNLKTVNSGGIGGARNPCYLEAFVDGLGEARDNLVIGSRNAVEEAKNVASDLGNTVASLSDMMFGSSDRDSSFDFKSKFFGQYDHLNRTGQPTDGYTAHAMADGASLNLKPLAEAGYEYYQTGDGAKFSQSCGGIATSNVIQAGVGKLVDVAVGPIIEGAGDIVGADGPVRGAVKGTKLSCFPAGTPVHTSAGLKPIEQIEEGERVWAFDHQRLVWAEREVVEAYQLLHQGTMATIQVRGETIRATGGHPFWVLRGEGLAQRPLPKRIAATESGGRLMGRWVLARDLLAGDEVMLRHGEVVPLESVHLDEVVQQVYNFTVAELQNYAVGTWGVLVHNANDPIAPRPGGTSPAGQMGALLYELSQMAKNGFTPIEIEIALLERATQLDIISQQNGWRGVIVEPYPNEVAGGWRVYQGMPSVEGGSRPAIAINQSNGTVLVGNTNNIRLVSTGDYVLTNFKPPPPPP